MKFKSYILGLCICSLLFTGCTSNKDDSVTSESEKSATNTLSVTTEPTENTSAELTDTPVSANYDFSAIDELSSVIESDVENTIAALNSSYEQLITEINSFDKYSENINKVESFYTDSLKLHNDLCIRMYEYSLNFAELILSSELTDDEKYEELDIIYDNIYDDAGDDIYDEFYDGCLDDIYDDFYDGILDDAYDTVEYKEWSDIRSNEYKLWSDTRSEIYDFWSDSRSDIYDFWSDIKSEVWDNDIEKALKKTEDFKADIDKLKNKAVQISTETTVSIPADDLTQQNSSTDSIRPEFKEAMDSYEAFFDEYCEFMIKYNENSDDLSLLADYLDYMTKYTETMAKLDEWNSDEMTDEEALYYFKVMNNINEKLLKASL